MNRGEWIVNLHVCTRFNQMQLLYLLHILLFKSTFFFFSFFYPPHSFFCQVQEPSHTHYIYAMLSCHINIIAHHSGCTVIALLDCIICRVMRLITGVKRAAAHIEITRHSVNTDRRRGQCGRKWRTALSYYNGALWCVCIWYKVNKEFETVLMLLLEDFNISYWRAECM